MLSRLEGGVWRARQPVGAAGPAQFPGQGPEVPERQQWQRQQEHHGKPGLVPPIGGSGRGLGRICRAESCREIRRLQQNLSLSHCVEVLVPCVRVCLLLILGEIKHTSPGLWGTP